MAQTLTSRTSNNGIPAPAACKEVSSTDVPQAGTATFIPVEEDVAAGWIDIRNYRRIEASAKAHGAGVTITCQTRSVTGAHAKALTLADGVPLAGATEQLLDQEVGAAYIRFLAAGTAAAAPARLRCPRAPGAGRRRSRGCACPPRHRWPR